MATTPFTAEELSWFDVGKYSLHDLPLAHWIRLLELRLLFKPLFDLRPGTPVLEPFWHFWTALMRDPSSTQGEGPYVHAFTHPTDTPCVRYMRVDDCHLVSRIAFVNTLKGQECFDVGQSTYNLGADLKGVAHLRVNLSSTETKIVEDFKTWLQRAYDNGDKRPVQPDYHAKVRKWSEFKYLPYYDLHVLSIATGQAISNELMCQLLELDTLAEPSDRLKAPRKSLKVFNESTLKAMRLQVS